MTVPFCISTISVWKSVSSHPHQYLMVSLFFNLAILMCVKCLAHLKFIFKKAACLYWIPKDLFFKEATDLFIVISGLCSIKLIIMSITNKLMCEQDVCGNTSHEHWLSCCIRSSCLSEKMESLVIISQV